MKKDKVSIIMGSQSDWKTLQLAENILNDFKISNEVKIVSAHRTPERLYRYAKNAHKNNIKVIIAGAGGAAHLPGMVASLTKIPVLGVPIESKLMNGLDSLLSIVQMPYGIPTATFAIGEAGAKNAALFAVSLFANTDKNISKKVFRQTGIIVIRKDFLIKYYNLKRSFFEIKESIDMLRFLENDIKIKSYVINKTMIGIDTKKDYLNFIKNY